MKRLPILLTLLACLVFSSCVTTGPSQEEIKSDIAGYALPSQPKSGKAIVYVVRPGILNAHIPFRVYVDNIKRDSARGTTLGKQYIYFDLEPGTHTIISQAENQAKVTVEAKPGDIIFIEQVAKPGAVASRNKATTIENDEGTYQVKRLKLGLLSKQ